MTTVIMILAVILCCAAGKIGYDWVIIESLKEKIRRRDIVIKSMTSMNRRRWMEENASVGIVVESDQSDTTFNGQENTL